MGILAGNGLSKTERCTLDFVRLQILAPGVFRSINNINPNYIQSLVGKNKISKRRPNEFIISFHNTATFGNKSI